MKYAGSFEKCMGVVLAYRRDRSMSSTSVKVSEEEVFHKSSVTNLFCRNCICDKIVL